MFSCKRVILWRKDQIQFVDVIIGVCKLSCIFKNCIGEFEWMFTGIYYRGNKEEISLL